MAANRLLAERGLVEIKMGKSKFPGKPSKIGNRKRVNLSSCALPEENDSSKAAKNIYLGLSVFNETFGDNEMVAPGPFYGFSLPEVEDALAEARLQQKEAEIEHKNQGIDINLWDIFQNELFSITSCSAPSNTTHFKQMKVNKSKLSFDGGGLQTNTESEPDLNDNSNKRPSRFFNNQDILAGKIQNTFKSPEIKIKKAIKFQSSRLKLKKLVCSPAPKKSLQSQAAKKLLDRAKWCNISENNKIAIAEKRFILPSHSIHSSRVIKPNKKFIEENLGWKKFSKGSVYKTKKLIGKCSFNNISNKMPITNLNEEFNGADKVKSTLKKDKSEVKSRTCESFKNESVSKVGLSNANVGKIILREPKLQLDKSNLSMLEGPFSTPSASSLNLNSHLKVSPMQSVVAPGSKICGVCGVVKLYRVVDIPKKFGIYCCEFCQKFISKIIKSFEEKRDSKLQCIRGNGLCNIIPMVKNQHYKIRRCAQDLRCQACWLQVCLKRFKIPIKLKQKLLNLLPVNMQMNINLEFHSFCNGSTQNFKLSNNIDDFKWLNENSNNQHLSHPEKNIARGTSIQIGSNKKSLRKRIKVLKSENIIKYSNQNNKVKADCDEKIRQHVILKGPRVKHVCRSASVALGQPLATFPSDVSPSKKQATETIDNCKNCDDTSKSVLNNEIQENDPKPNLTVALSDSKEQKDKKLSSLKEVNSNKIDKSAGQIKSKKKTNVKVEDPVSMDFWECYDPDEVCETGFGLIGSESFSVRALCFLCGSAGHEKLIHCASCCEPYHEFCVDEAQLKMNSDNWKIDWICPSCTICVTCGKSSGQQLRCVKCENSYHTECVDRVGGRLLHSPDRPWVCSACLRCKSCYGVDVSIFVGNLPLCKTCFVLRQKGNYCPLCQRCYEDDDYDSKMMECGQCKCWVHAKCEGLSDEKYQVLSFLPESVEYVCRMCCVMPPAPWWLAVEAELKSGYLGVLKALSKNRKACTMLKWSPRKQCTCRQIDLVSRNLNFENLKFGKKKVNDNNLLGEKSISLIKEKNQFDVEQEEEEKFQPASISERKASIEIINHPTESLKLTLKITKEVDVDVNDQLEQEEINLNVLHSNENQEKYNRVENKVRVKKCPSNEENGENSLINLFDCREDNITPLNFLLKGNTLGFSSVDFSYKKSLSSPLNPPSDSGIGSTDDELKTTGLTDEESSKLDEQQIDLKSHSVESKSNCDTKVSFLAEKRDCFCFLEMDSYNSRSKPFSPNLMSIKKKVTTSEYSSLLQFHQDMERMIETTHSIDLMDLYHQTIKEIFPWFDPKFSRVQNSSQKVTGSMSLETTPVKNTPVKSTLKDECRILKEKLLDKPLDYFYNNFVMKDVRICSLCKIIGDGLPSDTGRLLYCGQNEWVHCNCALWSGEVFEEIDGSLQNVHSAINRGRSIRCPECNLKGASIGCCARNCQETYHFSCARKIACSFMDDKTMYCPLHAKDSLGKLVQNEKEFEIRRPVYVELDKKKMKSVDSSQIHFAVGALQVNNLGKFVAKLSDQEEAIVPENFNCTRLYWSCFEPWRLVRYHFTVRLVEAENTEGFDSGINFTIDHSCEPELLNLKLKQLKHFQEHNTFLEINKRLTDENLKRYQTSENNEKDLKEKVNLEAISKKHKYVKKIMDHFESKEEENCLSDNQNTADLLPPDLEEAIFKDLPHDILDGISMQDIFMDIKADTYENNSKDGTVEDSSEMDESLENSSNKIRKSDCFIDEANQNELGTDGNCYNLDMSEDSFLISKTTRDFRRNKFDGKRETVALKTYQKSCKLNWKCKTQGAAHKRKKNSSKCHVTVNFLEPQERGNMLQELKFTDGLVTVTTGPLGSMKDLKSRLDENKRPIQEEGKENKCLPWHARLQTRLLQVDGGTDSSSSGSEAGESPQRVTDESVNSKLDVPSESFSNKLKPLFCSDYSEIPIEEVPNNSKNRSTTNCSRVDEIVESCYEFSEEEENKIGLHELRKRQKCDYSQKSFKNNLTSVFDYKIRQCDGGIDSDSEGQEEDLTTFGAKVISNGELGELKRVEEEPVKCSICHCTYRTKISYQRHLESCNSNFILSSSEDEMSDRESPKKHFLPQKSDKVSSPNVNGESSLWLSEKNDPKSSPPKLVSSPPLNLFNAPDSIEKLELKKEKATKRTYFKKKVLSGTKKTISPNNNQQVQQKTIIQTPGFAPTLIIQDINMPNVIPAAFIDSTPTVGYVASVGSQNSFGKTQLITSPNGIISSNYQLPSMPENQILGNFCLHPQNFQASVPGFIIQQPQTQSSLLQPQPAPVMMTSEQILLGSTGLIQDSNTGGFFLASYSHPVFYNMETIISNTVMQTNQFVSNVLATTYSQTSTQIFRTSELEQVANLPSNYIVVGPNPPSDELVCLPTPQTFISNQTAVQVPNPNIVNPISTIQTFNSEAKVGPAQFNTFQNVQPVCSPVLLSKINSNTVKLSQPVSPVIQKENSKAVNIQTKGEIKNSLVINKNQLPSSLGCDSIAKPEIGKLQSKTKILDKTSWSSKPKLQPKSGTLVDYINNFKSDISDASSPSVSQINAQEEIKVQDYSADIKTTSNYPESKPVTKRELLPLPSLNGTSKPSGLIHSSKCYLPITKKKKIETSETTKIVNFSKITASDSTMPSLSVRTMSPSDQSLKVSSSDIPKLNETQGLKKVVSNSLGPEESRVSSVNGVDVEKTDEIIICTDAQSKVEEASKVPFSNCKAIETDLTVIESEVNQCLNMPLLEEYVSVPVVKEELSKVTNDSVSLKDKSPKNEVLPLKENIQTNANIQNLNNSISPSSISSNDKSAPLTKEEIIRNKKKYSLNDQNLDLNISIVKENELLELTEFERQKSKKKLFLEAKCEVKGPKLIFDVVSDDGFKSSSTSMVELWANICDSVQEMRTSLKIPTVPVARKGYQILGMQNHGLQHCLEQLKGVEQCINYKCKYFVKEKQAKEDAEEEAKGNPSGCARTEKFTTRKDYDMFAWLASKHRQLPKLTETAEETLSSIRRANNLPMAMRYRNLKETAKLYVGVYRSKIHGRGLFCLREIEAGEMVIEYAGEVIRSNLTDKREKYYTDRGIGCYMFRIDDHFVVDATMKGNAARFINHSCEPNCYSRVVDILGKKHIVIFALRKINLMEELTYDYKFPFEDEKISCHCLSKKCKKYLN